MLGRVAIRTIDLAPVLQQSFDFLAGQRFVFEQRLASRCN